VDLTDPTRAVTPTLDGPVLAVLARAGKQGIVRATEMGRNRVHELNREHLGAPVAGLLADLRLELWNRFRKTLGAWNPKPVYGCVFGSAARGDGDAQSDIDLLLVHAPLPGENDPHRRPSGVEAVAGFASEFTAVQLTERQLAKWGRQADQLRGLVRGWTGNPLQVLEMSTFQWADQQRRQSALFVEISRNAVEVVGSPPWSR
jgi:hypothetical protein